MKKKRRAKSRNKKLSQMKKDLADKGANLSNLEARAKKRRTLGDLEASANQRMIDMSDDDNNIAEDADEELKE